MVRQPVAAVLADVSRQTGLRFDVSPESKGCRMSALLRDINVREFLQILQVTHWLSCQREDARSPFSCSASAERTACPRTSPARPASGTCRPAAGKGLSLECRDGPMSKFAELVFDRTDANILLMGGADEYPVNVQLVDATLDKAMRFGPLGLPKALTYQRIGRSKTYVFSVRKRAGE